MKYLAIALLLGTTLLSAESKIVDGKLVLDTRSECRKRIDHAKHTFAGHSGDYYSVEHLGSSAMNYLPSFCVDREDSRDLDQLKAEIDFNKRDVERHSFRPGHVGPKRRSK